MRVGLVGCGEDFGFYSKGEAIGKHWGFLVNNNLIDIQFI